MNTIFGKKTNYIFYEKILENILHHSTIDMYIMNLADFV